MTVDGDACAIIGATTGFAGGGKAGDVIAAGPTADGASGFAGLAAAGTAAGFDENCVVLAVDVADSSGDVSRDFQGSVGAAIIGGGATLAVSSATVLTASLAADDGTASAEAVPAGVICFAGASAIGFAVRASAATTAGLIAAGVIGFAAIAAGFAL